MGERSRKAVINEDGRSITVYHEGREYLLSPTADNGGTWVAEDARTGRIGIGFTVWNAILDVHRERVLL